MRDAGLQGFDVGPDELWLPEGRMLVAAIYGEPSRRLSSGPRSSFLCAGAHDDVVVRSSAGKCLWSERHAEPGALLPRDWGGESQAMTDIAHFLDWVNVETYEISDSAVVGNSENFGQYVAQFHTQYRFVTLARVGGFGAWRTLLKMTAFCVAARDEEVLTAVDADPRRLRSYLD